MADPKTAINGVSHVGIRVSDMERSKAFYREFLGWTEIFDSEIQADALVKLMGPFGAGPDVTGRACGGRIGDLRVELVQIKGMPADPPTRGLGIGQLTLAVDNAQGLYERLTARGVRTMSPPVEIMDCRIFFALDPDGQPFEFVEYLVGESGWSNESR
jgi:lactoylglutathione lyase